MQTQDQCLYQFEQFPSISELMNSKDSKSTQRAVTRSIKLFREFLIQKNEPGEFETYTKQKLNEMLRLFYASIKDTLRGCKHRINVYINLSSFL
jgi:hypothetical protein